MKMANLDAVFEFMFTDPKDVRLHFNVWTLKFSFNNAMLIWTGELYFNRLILTVGVRYFTLLMFAVDPEGFQNMFSGEKSGKRKVLVLL